jgi:aspartate carbamoyltransferase regulatory subunit
MPQRITGVAKCSNPRCITNVEDNVPYEFVLTDKKGTYRCLYCETKAKRF